MLHHLWQWLRGLFAPAEWRVLSASVQGSTHERQGLPCQDAHLWKLVSPDTLIIAVADGAGSARYAHEGAWFAVRAMVEFLRRQSRSSLVGREGGEWRALAVRAVEAVRHSLAEQAKRRRVALSDFASTLIGVVVMPQAVAVVQIGDGAVVLEDTQGQLYLLTHTRVGEYLNETVFLTSRDALQYARFEWWKGEAKHLAVFTDGLELLAIRFSDAMPHAPFFKPLFQWVDSPKVTKQRLETFLRSAKVRDRTGDDLTLVLVGRRR